MKKITPIDALKTSIENLENKQQEELLLLKRQLLSSYEELKPVNFIKNTLKDLTSAPNLKGDLLNATISLGAGYISKKLAIGSTHSIIKQLLGTFLQMGVTNIVSENVANIKTVTQRFIKSLFSSEKKSAAE